MSLKAYIQNHYGTCALGLKKCECQKTGRWYGTMCPHWEPLEASNWEELRELQLRRLEEKKEDDDA